MTSDEKVIAEFEKLTGFGDIKNIGEMKSLKDFILRTRAEAREEAEKKWEDNSRLNGYASFETGKEVGAGEERQRILSLPDMNDEVLSEEAERKGQEDGDILVTEAYFSGRNSLRRELKKVITKE